MKCDKFIFQDGTSFFVHRIILAACSEHLQSLLYKRDQKRKLIIHGKSMGDLMFCVK